MAKKHSGAQGSTPATVALAKLGIDFEVRSYQHDPSVTDFGREAADALGVPAERVFKTLLADADGSLVVGIVPVAGKLDLKALAAAVGARKAAMADPTLAQRKTGYVVGGISPFGQKKRVPVAIEAAALVHDVVLVNGGQRGLLLQLAPQALADVLQAVVADLAAG